MSDTTTNIPEPSAPEPQADAQPTPQPESPPRRMPAAEPPAEPVNTNPDQRAKGIRESIARALARQEKGEKPRSEPYQEGDPYFLDDEPETAPKSEPKDEGGDEGPLRDEHGRFKAKEEGEEPKGDPKAEAKPGEKPVEKPAEKPPVEDQWSAPPRNLNLEGKALEDWKAAPATVRESVTRRVGELEQGLTEYRQKWEPLRQWDELARQHQTDIPTALNRYVAFEQGIRQNPEQGLVSVAKDMGFDFYQLVARIANRKPEDIARADQGRVGQMTNVISGLQKQVGQLTQYIQNIEQRTQAERHQANLSEVQKFADAHPRFDELAPQIAYLMKENRSLTLAEAYSEAERWKPAAPAVPPPGGSNPPNETARPAPADDRGRLSVAGAPAAGSDPEGRKISGSTREAVRRAMRRTGL